MKILCVIDSLGSGGAQRQLVELAISFQALGHSVSFLTYHNLPFYESRLREFKITNTCINENSYLKRLMKMRTFIRSGSFDIVLSFLQGSNFISEISGFPKRRWGLIVGERSANPFILKSLKLRFFRWVHLFSDFVVANSQVNIDLVRKANPLLSSKKCKVIYNIVDEHTWNISGSAKSSFDIKGNDRFVILIAARHQYLKNLKGLIEGVKLLESQEREKVLIKWIGDERKDNSLQDGLKLIKQYGLEENFVFRPATKEIAYEMSIANAIGLFSHYEGFPNTICEAMYLGKPVVCSSVSDIPLLFPEDNQILCDPKNSDTIMKSIKYIMTRTPDELLKMGKKNRLIALSNFSKATNVKQYLDIMTLLT